MTYTEVPPKTLENFSTLRNSRFICVATARHGDPYLHKSRVKGWNLKFCMPQNQNIAIPIIATDIHTIAKTPPDGDNLWSVSMLQFCVTIPSPM